MKQIIKKSLVCFLALCFFITTGAVVIAEESSIIINPPAFDIETGELIISGMAESQKGSLPVVFELLYKGETVAAEQVVTEQPVNGVVSFEFTGVVFESTTPSGDYEIYVSADFIKAEETLTYSYIGADLRFKAMTELNTAIDKNDDLGIIETMETYKTLFCSGDETLFSLSEDSQEKFAELLIAKGRYALPDNYTDEGNDELVIEEAQKVATNYAELLVIASAVDLTSEEKLVLWIDKYADANGLYLDNEETEYDETVMAKYFKEAVGEEAFYSKISASAESAEDFAALKAGMLEAGVLTMLETSRAYKLQEITEALPELFTVDFDAFGELSSSKQAAVYNDLVGGIYKTSKDYTDAFDKAVKDNEGSSGGDGGSRGGSSGGSRGGSSGGSSSNQIRAEIDTESSNTSAVFTDLGGYEWATEAISYLKAEGVVSGKNTNTFDPAANVTRAEFVKMVVQAFELEEAEYNGEFADVSASDWFAPYVAAAYKAGVAMGNEDDEFIPNAPITRQDIAVLMYRAGELSPSENEKDIFTDSKQISDYAKSAVFVLYENGIILGDGDGSFAPMRNANRAEAAVMIYRMLMI